MNSYKILAIKKMAGRNISIEMNEGTAFRLAEKYGCRVKDLIRKEVTLDETEIWENLRINMLEKDIKTLQENPLYWALCFSQETFKERYKNLNAWSTHERERLSKYVKTKEVRVSYIITDILVSVERTRTITEFCGWKSVVS